jgi:hypothetical protein
MITDKIFGAVKVVGNFGLPMDKAWARVARIALLSGLMAFIAELVVGISPLVNPLYVPIIVALGTGIDKALRELIDHLKKEDISSIQ